MKCWIVPSSLFVPGRIFAPARLQDERRRLVERMARLEAELRNLPKKISEIEQEIARGGEQYQLFSRHGKIMIFAQFFDRSVMSKDLIEACGDRAVVILDGRESTDTHNRIAAVECVNRGYLAYMLCKGDSFTRSSSIGPITLVFKDAAAAHDACMNGRHVFVTLDHWNSEG